MHPQSLQLGQILLKQKRITEKQLEEALRAQKKEPDKKLGEVLVELGAIGEWDLVHALEEHLHMPSLDLGGTKVDAKAIDLLPQELAKKYEILPVGLDGNVLTIVTSDPMNYYAMDDIRLATNRELRVMLSTASDIRNAIANYYSGQQAEEAAEDLSKLGITDMSATLEEDEQMGDRIENAPVVRLVNSIITQAVKIGASDVHIEPSAKETHVRMRVDGLLHNRMSFPMGAHSSVITRLKIMGGMNIAERRVPQDGRVEMMVDGHTVDLRLSTLPTVSGEKMVVRVLGGTGAVLSREQLGLGEENARRFSRMLKAPNGMILVSGPTGSGKSTTLYSVLNDFNSPEVNVITVEDPVEFRLEGVNQVQINTKAGLTFASGLRSILRQDPDIIMIGEIRDNETAEIAVRAAITGHLVFSTVHTNDAVSTVSRLANMGVEPFLISSALVGVVAQRLIRRVCPHCAERYSADGKELKVLGAPAGTMLTRGRGCDYCNRTGYKGRIAVHEILLVDQEVRSLIESGASDDAIRQAAVQNGMVTLADSCRSAVLDGFTTVSEMLRVAYQFDM